MKALVVPPSGLSRNNDRPAFLFGTGTGDPGKPGQRIAPDPHFHDLELKFPANRG
jgi:hypothetical protein